MFEAILNYLVANNGIFVTKQLFAHIFCSKGEHELSVV